jgi:hypothetical protein
MRIEILAHLNKFGIDNQFLEENVFFADDINLTNINFIESVALVDFNKINIEL